MLLQSLQLHYEALLPPGLRIADPPTGRTERPTDSLAREGHPLATPRSAPNASAYGGLGNHSDLELLYQTACARPRRKRSGLFYTPPGLAMLMCKLALEEYLIGNRVPADTAEATVWGPYAPNVRRLSADGAVLAYSLLSRVTVLDPSCGCGAFLVAMLALLRDAAARAAAISGACHNPAEWTAQSIARIYGIDVDEGALRIASLRLRLTLAEGGVTQAPPPSLTCRNALQNGVASKFDIIVGNPPYVRHESAQRLDGAGDQQGGRRPIRGTADVYAHFIRSSIDWLAQGGVCCLVTSNSWLDSAYGQEVRGALLAHGSDVMVLEDVGARAFAEAAVNTAILLFHAGPARPTESVRFVSMDRGRVSRCLALPKPQLPPTDPWGGPLLRAPDVFNQVISRFRDRVVPLGQIAKVRFGLKSGANQFFYLQELGPGSSPGTKTYLSGHFGPVEIEERFLRPIVVSPKQCATSMLTAEALHTRVLCCPNNAAELTDTKALDYMRRAEALPANIAPHLRPSCRGRRPWWHLGRRSIGALLWPMAHGGRPVVLLNPHGVWADHNLFELHCPQPHLLWAWLSSPIGVVAREVYARANLGHGGLKTEGADTARLPVPNPDLFDRLDAAVADLWKPAALAPISPVSEYFDLPERRDLDDALLGAFGLTPATIDELRDAAVQMVRRRTERSRAVLEWQFDARPDAIPRPTAFGRDGTPL